MTKKQMVQEILEDMYRYNPTDEVNKRFKGYLNRISKSEVEEIYSIRLGDGTENIEPLVLD